MKRFVFGALVALISFPAIAADMPIKAPLKSSYVGAYPYESGGAYFGVGMIGETEKIALGGPIAGTNTFAAGGALAGTVGYTKPLSPGSWVAIEATAAYANTGTDVCGNACSVSSKVSGELLVKYGGNLDTLSALIPNLGSITGFPTLPSALPPGAENPLLHPYIGAGLLITRDQLDMLGASNHGIKTRGIMRAGLLTQKNNGTVIDTWAEWSPKRGAGLSLPSLQADVGTRYRVGLTAFWGLTKN